MWYSFLSNGKEKRERIDMEKLCYGCMRQKQQSPLCEHCGYNENINNLPHQLPVGTVLAGRYLLGKVLGQGGFGITYIGQDRETDRIVAVKEFYPGKDVSRDCSDSLSVSISEDSGLFRKNAARFLKEANLLSKFTHIPSIVRVFDFFEENDTAYIVMEYLQGVTLKAYVQLMGGSLTPEHTLLLLEPVLSALETVHGEALVHRDISPDNIMILPEGKAKLLDFGAAREAVTEEDGHAIRSTEAILKHGFAPIEQYQRRGVLGPWTDIYALCATVYYCLTGEVPLDAPERLTGDDDISWDRVAGLTPRQRRALEEGMAPNWKLRTQSIPQLRSGLLPPEKTAPEKPARKRPGIFLLAAVPALFLLAGAAAVFLSPKPEPQRLEAPAQTLPETTAQPAETTLETIPPQTTLPTTAPTESSVPETTEDIQSVTTDLDSGEFTFRREMDGDDLTITGDYLTITVEDGKKVTITIEGLSLANGYSTNKWHSYLGQLEYYWGVEMESDQTYAIATAVWADDPRTVRFKSMLEMPSAAWIVSRDGTHKKMGAVTMTHTDTSITFKYTINRLYPSGYENVEKFTVRVVDTSTDLQATRTYTLKEE